MARIFLTHVPDMLRNFYGERAVKALRELGEVRLNDTGRVLEGGALAAAARGCEIVVSDRQTPGPAEFFATHQAFDTVGQVAELVAGRMPPHAVNAEAATRLARLRKA